jgi:bisanhydrobacterioruberin hydratase
MKRLLTYFNITYTNPKVVIATSIAILFHIIGLVGFLFFKNDFFSKTTALNLLLSFFLLLYTQQQKNTAFYFFVAIAFAVGFLVEVIGVNTGWLFGNYAYGNVLGPQWKKVPLVIGVNWFIVMYTSGITVHMILQKIINYTAVHSKETSKKMQALSLIVDGATLAVFFDWVLEPIAIKLKFWYWLGDGTIPPYNYLCWFAVSMFLLTIFHFCKFEKQNKFAVNLLLIQMTFFLLLRTFMN